MRIVLIMPVYNEARHLPAVLESIAAQDIDAHRLFLVAVDGNSTDRSGDILRSWLAGGRIRGVLLHNPRRAIPISLNMALRCASTEDLVLRLDAHTVYEPAYVRLAVAALQDAPADVGCVGCAQVPIAGPALTQRVVAALYTNPMGLGGADFRVGEGVREVENIYLGAWRPGVLAQLGGFDERLRANEDADLSARLRRSGYRILRVQLPCRCYVKRSLLGTLAQWNRYGYWRAQMLRRNPDALRIRHVIAPLAAILGIAVLLSPVRVVLLPAYAGYAAMIFRYRQRGETVTTTCISLFYFPVLQFAFAIGMLGGLTASFGNGFSRTPASALASQTRS